FAAIETQNMADEDSTTKVTSRKTRGAKETLKTTGILYPISNHLSYESFSPNHIALLAAITSNDEPRSFLQAIKNEKWREALRKEIIALEENSTWTLEGLPPDKRAIDSKWVYKIKYKPDGSIEHYKARPVAKGFTQIEGLDYHETFAPIAKLVTVRVLLALASISFIAVLIDVDDIIITSNDTTRINTLKKNLHTKFSIKDLMPLKYFLGIEGLLELVQALFLWSSITDYILPQGHFFRILLNIEDWWGVSYI
ncbi:hypothetical protein SLEP1_g59381, partial [Rubroshorea leprosula]